MKKYNLGMSVILIVISTAMLKQSNTYGSAAKGTAMGSGVWPGILAVTMIIWPAFWQWKLWSRKETKRRQNPYSFVLLE